MPIRHRIYRRVKLPIHLAGGSVLDPPHDPPRYWQNGAEVTRKYGNKILLLGFIHWTGRQYRCWRVNKEVEAIYRTEFGMRKTYWFPVKRSRLMTREEALAAFNPWWDVTHAGSIDKLRRADAEDIIIDAYETFFETAI